MCGGAGALVQMRSADEGDRRPRARNARVVFLVLLKNMNCSYSLLSFKFIYFSV